MDTVFVEHGTSGTPKKLKDGISAVCTKFVNPDKIDPVIITNPLNKKVFNDPMFGVAGDEDLNKGKLGICQFSDKVYNEQAIDIFSVTQEIPAKPIDGMRQCFKGILCIILGCKLGFEIKTDIAVQDQFTRESKENVLNGEHMGPKIAEVCAKGGLGGKIKMGAAVSLSLSVAVSLAGLISVGIEGTIELIAADLIGHSELLVEGFGSEAKLELSALNGYISIFIKMGFLEWAFPLWGWKGITFNDNPLCGSWTKQGCPRFFEIDTGTRSNPLQYYQQKIGK